MLNVIIVIISALIAAMSYLIVTLYKRFEKYQTSTQSMLTSLAENITKHEKVNSLLIEINHDYDEMLKDFSKRVDDIAQDVSDLSGKLQLLDEEFDENVKELVLAQAERERAEARSEEAWANGVNNIINYGGGK
jgi:uncharacterized membrane-anchored protein YhcB (DUF1043 family)